jgi:LysR family glycine cleavage system transcriptional activator
MFDSALSGRAVILADARMTGADEEAGRLVCLTDRCVERAQGIHVVTASSTMGRKVRAFSDWLKAEAHAIGQDLKAV